MSIASLFAGLGGLSSLGGLGLQWLNDMESRRFFDTDAGTVNLGRNFRLRGDSPRNKMGEGGTVNPTLRGERRTGLERNLDRDIVEASRDIPGFGYLVQQERENQRALGGQKNYADQNVDQVRGGSLAGADDFLKSELAGGNPEAISQSTFDRLVAAQNEKIAGDTAARRRTMEGDAARLGLDPTALAAVGNENNEAESRAMAEGLRDLLIQREVANKQYGLDLSRTAGSVGSTYNSLLGDALLTRGALEQPINYAALGDAISAFRLAGQNTAQQNAAAMSSNLLGLGSGLINFGMSDLESRRMADASQRSPWEYLGGPLILATGQALA